MSTKKQTHMRYGSWDTEWENFLSFWSILCPLTPSPPPLTTQKIKILKKWKKHLKISSFYTCVPKITIIWCMLADIWSVTDIFCHFRPFFSPFTKLLTLKIKIWKKRRAFILLHMCTIYENHKMHGSWDKRQDGRDHLLPFDPNKPKNQNLKKWKKHLEIISFYTCVP